MTLLRQLWNSHPLALLGFLAGALVTIVFVARLGLFALYWSDPRHREMVPEPWMTPGFIAHSWHLPPEDVAAQLGLTEKPDGKPPTLGEIARDTGEPLDALLTRLDAWLEAQPAAAPVPRGE